MTIKIGVAGTHSTGKSEFLAQLATRLQARGHSVGRVGDLATAARRAGFPILRDHTFESTTWIMARGIQCELEEGLANDIVLVDRPTPDALGYLLAALEHTERQIDDKQMRFLQEWVGGHSSTYSLLIKTKVDHSLPIDVSKERDLDERFRLSAARAIDSVFSNLDLPSTELGTHNKDEVLDNIMAFVAGYGHL